MPSRGEQPWSFYGLALARAMSFREEEDHADSRQIHGGRTTDGHESDPRVPKSIPMSAMPGTYQQIGGAKYVGEWQQDGMPAQVSPSPVAILSFGS